MKRFDYGNTLTLLANVGVIGGLVLVALELRQTTNAIQASAYQARAESSIEWDIRNAESPTLAPLIFRYLDDGRDALNPEEQFRFSSNLQAGFKRQEAEYYAYELGLLDQIWYERTFSTHMKIWVPRWRDWGLLDDGAYIREVARPTFLVEIEKYLDEPNLDAQRELYGSD